MIANVDNVCPLRSKPQQRRKKDKLVQITQPAEEGMGRTNEYGCERGWMDHLDGISALQQLCVQKPGIAGHALLAVRLIVCNQQNSH